MRTLIIAIFLIGTLSQLKAQSDDAWGYGLEIEPKAVTQQFKRDEYKDGNTMPGASIAANIYYHLNSHIQLKSGLSFSLMQVEETDYNIFFGSDIDPMTGPDYYASWLETDYRIYYIGIPLNAIIYPDKARKLPYISLGLETMLKIAETGQTLGYEQHGMVFSVSDDFLVPANFILILEGGIGYQFSISDQSVLYIEPGLEFSPNNIFDKKSAIITDDQQNSSYFNYSLKAGVRF